MEAIQVKPQAASKPHSPDTSNSKSALISEWVVRFALNAEKGLPAKEQAVYRTMWEEGFSDVDAGRLKAAFVACLRSHTFKTIPTIGDIRQHLQKAQGKAAEEHAELNWQRVVKIRRVSWNPDMPGAGLPKFSKRVGRAVRASGIFNQSDMGPEALHVWAKKRFIEAFIRYGELERDGFLLPEGEVKHLFTDWAEAKALPVPAVDWADLRARSLDYAKKLKTDRPPQPDLKTPRFTFKRPLHSMDEQKEILRKRGLL